MDIKLVKNIRRRRSDCSWRKNSISSSLKDSDMNEMIEYPSGPIHIVSSWNPINKSDKPPYSYATIIGHAILTSKERKLTLNDIYVWITENYPFYSNDTQGWQNSIRHNLSLHKAFVKIDRDSTTQNPPRKGCFWTIRQGKEKSFIDNLQKPVNSVRKQQSLSQINTSSVISLRRQQQLRRSSVSTNSNDNGSFNTFRTTVIPTIVPESEAIVVTSSSSSDHHSSSNTSSPIYHQLIVPESNTTLHVYPADEQELFGDDLQSYTSSYLADHQPPSLSPCDAYSTTSSFADYYNTRASQDYSNSFNTYKTYPASGYQYNNMMDYTQEPLKHENNIFPPYYYVQQQQPRLDGNGEFSSFLHR